MDGMMITLRMCLMSSMRVSPRLGSREEGTSEVPGRVGLVPGSMGVLWERWRPDVREGVASTVHSVVGHTVTACHGEPH